MLHFLSGTAHLMITGLTVIDCDSKKIITKTSVTKIFFHRLTDVKINEYVETDEPMTKAGGYAIQGKGAYLLKKLKVNTPGLWVCPSNFKTNFY